MIKTSVEIPEIFDVTDPVQLQQFCVAVKMFCDELARKAKSIQTEIRSSAPTAVNQFEVEGEDVRVDTGVARSTYTLLNGSIRFHTET